MLAFHYSFCFIGDKISYLLSSLIYCKHIRKLGKTRIHPEKYNKTAQNKHSERFLLVGVSGFEPEASWTRTKRDTKLRHTPIDLDIIMKNLLIVKGYWEFCNAVPRNIPLR